MAQNKLAHSSKKDKQKWKRLSMAQKRKEMAKKVLMKTVPQKKNILKNAMANSVKTLKVLAMCKHLQIDAFWPKKQ